MIVAASAEVAILGAAIVDDILAMLILGVAVGLADSGANFAALAVSAAVAFVAFFTLGGTRLMQRRPGILRTGSSVVGVEAAARLPAQQPGILHRDDARRRSHARLA